MDRIIRATAGDGFIKYAFVNAKDTVQEACRIHNCAPTAAAALGRTLCAASLMGDMMKEEEATLTIRINGGGPAGTVLAVADGKGCVKGYIQNPVVELPLRADGKLNVGGAIGKDGVLSVVRDLGLKEPYVGQIPLVSGEVAEDVTAYYAVSEQIPTVCALGVLVNPDLTIAYAGGYMVQLLPGALDSEIDMLENNVAKAPSITHMMREGMTPEDIMQKVLEGFEPNVLDEYDVGYRCDCNQLRVEKAIVSLGREELEKIAEEEGTIEVCCQFCDKKYQVDTQKLPKDLQ